MTNSIFEEYGRKYFDFGFKITQISEDIKDTDEDPFKKPINDDWKYFALKNQKSFDDWWNSYSLHLSGVGTILGPDLRCIDIDGC